MKCFNLLVITFLVIKIQVANAGLYEANNSITANSNELYSTWVKEQLSTDIFSNPKSPYFGIKTDCADAAFALIIIFSYEYKIPFSFIDNDGHAHNQNTPKFDHIPEENGQRLKAFIDFISENAGTEVLADKNTYPIDVSAILPGDMYIAKWVDSNGEVVRHVYIIKEVLPTGDLLLYSATTPRGVRSLLPRKGMPTRLFDQAPFGFKRFNSITREDYSTMQYHLAKAGQESFFKSVKNLLKKSEDTLELNIDRRFENICNALNLRIEIVEQALVAKKTLSQKCFTKDQYDQYSTPSRDNNLILDIERLRNGYRTIVKEGHDLELSDKKRISLDYLIEENKTDDGVLALKELCNIKVANHTLSIKSFYDRFKAGLVSSNPNDHLESRWGLEPSKRICSKL